MTRQRRSGCRRRRLSIKRKRHTSEQIIHKLRQADAELAAGQPIADAIALSAD
jgi:hypothetical protein